MEFAHSLGCRDIEFSCEDAARSDKDFLVIVLKSVIAAGATTLNIPDTVRRHPINKGRLQHTPRIWGLDCLPSQTC